MAEPPDAKLLYHQHCSICHGEQGRGDGPAALFLFPKPRDFTRGEYKIRSTPFGQMPTDEDLYRIISNGMPRGGMPGFGFLKEAERRALVEYVKGFHPVPGGQPLTPIAVGAEPSATEVALDEGRKLYTQTCAICHGPEGRGDGPSAPTLRDSAGLPTWPADLTTDHFLGGSSNREIYLRVAGGMSGTPMPAVEGLRPEQIWALVQYVQTLRAPSQDQYVSAENATLRAIRLQGALPRHPDDPRWQTPPDYLIPMQELWRTPQPLRGVRVRAAHNGKQLALWLQWKAAVPVRSAVGQQEFRDGVAVQFSMDGSYTSLGMGSEGSPVNVWHWKSDWQEEVEGQRRDVDTAQKRLHVDAYPRKEPMFLTAEAAGNPMSLAKRATPVEDLNARGFGTLTTQTLAGQNVSGWGEWKEGVWQVVMVRDLASADKLDAQLRVGESLPVAFAVFVGARTDRGGQKSVSTWYNLHLEK